MRHPSAMPGPGDQCTWPAFASLPNDPRTPDVAELSDAMDVTSEVRAWLRVADGAIIRGDLMGFSAAMQTLREYLAGMTF